MVVDGAMNGELFLAYVRQQLVPTLQAGDIVVLDNPRLTKWPVCGKRSSRRRQARLLAAVQPDFNPIELVFSKLKWLLRKRRTPHRRRSVELFRPALDHVLPQECIHYFRHCGCVTPS